MGKMENVYDLNYEQSNNDLKFLFVSHGKADVIKAIEYRFVQQLGNKNVYNLGFGDYNINEDEILDDVNTNNGDAYKVFNTVLSTIPIFFEIFKDELILVQGSDSRPEFIDNCKSTCKKNCLENCKKFNRRINVYIEYVNKNYAELIVDYQFIGGKIDINDQLDFEQYVVGEKYNLVLLSKRTA